MERLQLEGRCRSRRSVARSTKPARPDENLLERHTPLPGDEVVLVEQLGFGAYFAAGDFDDEIQDRFAHFLDRRFRIVSDDENEKAFAAKIDMFRRGVFQLFEAHAASWS